MTDAERLDWLEAQRHRINSILGPDSDPQGRWAVWYEFGPDPEFLASGGTIRDAIDYAAERLSAPPAKGGR